MQRNALFVSITGFFVVVFLGFSAVAFAGNEADQAFKWPALFRIATPATQSASFASANGWGPMLQAETGMDVRVVPEDSEIRRYIRFALKKEFELVSTSIAEVGLSIQGDSGYAIQEAVHQRAVWHHNDTPWSFAVRGDSKYKTIYDLKQKGVRVALSSQSPPMMLAVQEALPAFLGWTKEEAAANWTFVPVGSYPENCRTITDGKADVSYMTPISSITYEMEAHPQKIRWLGMPADNIEGWDGYLKVRPTIIPNKIDFGVPSAIGVDAMTSPFIFWTRPDVDQEMVYHLTKWFHERFEQYKGVHAINARMSMAHTRTFLDRSAFPIAEGTIRYLREIGQWTEADDHWNQAQIDLMERWIAARNAAFKEAKSKKIKLHWENKEYLDILKKHTEGLPVFKTRL
ncbi:MAG: hypothetical protein VR64_13375 [Desulfatitalea sp. BRH_c12]|nr:MAG: hypothetical protein VR64_13375 [Desulfatitalea sp. BRH_c12]